MGVSSLLEEHLGYVSDSVRLDRFAAAIVQAVQPGMLAVDLGCGTGILGQLCLQAGASGVCAIDSTEMLEIAREAFGRAGHGDSCRLIRGRSFRVNVAEPADLVICDHVGYFGFDYGIIELMADARRRFLKPGGVVMPRRIKLFLGGVDSQKAREKVDAWRLSPVPREYHWIAAHGVNTKHAVNLVAGDILGAPAALGTIDLAADTPDFLSWRTELTIERAGTLHGLAGWFECELADGIWMTNSPLASDAIVRPQAFLPIEEPVTVEAGETVLATIMARPSDHLLAWTVELPRSGRRFSHSTWKSTVLRQDDLRKGDPARIPRLTRSGRARSIVLGYCDGARSAGEIERLVLAEHPELMPTPTEISRLVAEVLARETAA